MLDYISIRFSDRGWVLVYFDSLEELVNAKSEEHLTKEEIGQLLGGN